ncbi:hypothetical protein [Streptomyces sp. NPDC059224]|uniref:hypothetical protein n=1 Tax=Streptomyces sp. NPDC059224 TaxID=3346775 RepID=UPI0036B7DE1C
MTFKNTVFAAAVTVALAGGITGTGTLSASAATARYGSHRIGISSKKPGTSRDPRFAETMARTGRPTVPHRAGGADPAEAILPRPGRTV